MVPKDANNDSVDPGQTAFLVIEFSGTTFLQFFQVDCESHSITVSLMNNSASCSPLPSSCATAAVTVGSLWTEHLWSV